jgi:phage-related protein
VSWRISFYSVRLEQEILRLSRALVARFIRYAERMEKFGPDLGMPHTRALGEGLFELRLKAPGGIARIFYCTLGGRRIMMLHQYVKKSEKTPPKELGIARRRMREVKREIN